MKKMCEDNKQIEEVLIKVEDTINDYYMKEDFNGELISKEGSHSPEFNTQDSLEISCSAQSPSDCKADLEVEIRDELIIKDEICTSETESKDVQINSSTPNDQSFDTGGIKRSYCTYKCAVLTCDSKPGKKLSFFRFPNGDRKRCMEWLKLCDQEYLADMDLGSFHKKLKVCAKHFENNMFLNDLKNRLQPHAKPVKYLNGELNNQPLYANITSTNSDDQSVNIDLDIKPFNSSSVCEMESKSDLTAQIVPSKRSKGLSGIELRQILLEEVESDKDPDDGEWSANDEEIITQLDHHSDSKLEYEKNKIDSIQNTQNSDSEVEYEAHNTTSDDSSDDNDNFYTGRDNKTKWRKTDYHSTSSERKSKNIFKSLSGAKGTAKLVTTEAEAFLKLIDDSIIGDILHYTNLFIDKKRKKVDYSRERDSKIMTKSELLAVLGMLFLIGTKKENRTSVKQLWTDDGTGMPILRACMSSKRFLFLLRSIRFDDQESREKIDKLAAIRTILNKFNTNCKESYNLGELVTIDEKLEPFRGKCSFIQFMPNKPVKHGLKIFALCDSKTFYTSAIEVYCGEQPQGPYFLSNNPSDILKRLTNHIKGTYRTLTTNKFYSNHALARSLLNQNITTIGALRKNNLMIPREFLSSKNRSVGSSLHGFQKEVTIVSYVPQKAKMEVLLSTKHNKKQIDEAGGKPQILLDYDMSKDAVEMVDQLCARYSVTRTTRRWPLALFYAILNIAGINAQVLIHNVKNTKDKRRLFLKKLSLQLMESHLVERSRITSLPTDIQMFLQRYKEPIVEQRKDKQKKKRGRCNICGRLRNKFTSIACDSCDHFVCREHSTTEIRCERCKNKIMPWSDDED